MELNGFMIGPEIKTLFKIKVGAVIAEHPVVLKLIKGGWVNLDTEGVQNPEDFEDVLSGRPPKLAIPRVNTYSGGEWGKRRDSLTVTKGQT